ncbi:hypothetical protein PaG_06142 [Moesziomyces aphidis]|uniref:Heparan-alpha-glucosaminide N-acetyltransferase catalytic domain-containing protein n=1 Tax=Moesziomyces aphidis TaxID=84754 RepID=W3VE68_MOEAP|nr:hypothetical protein PaG_06142 [Moesziomyces aphidis]
MSNVQEATAAVQEANFSSGVAGASMGEGGEYGSIARSDNDAGKPSVAPRVVAPDVLRGLILALMSLDHAALFMGAWLHGTPKQTESAATVMRQWNFNAAYVSRTLTHLCAPGFFFLMGMGTVYLHRSRTRLGRSSARLARHFGVRALALTAVSEVMGWLLMRGRGALVINIVLIGLAVDYLLTGLLCLLVQKTEKAAAVALDRWQGDKQQSERQPLLTGAAAGGEQGGQDEAGERMPSERAQTTAFWLHNALLAVLTYVTIFWNVWLSPTHGHCSSLQALTSASELPNAEVVVLLMGMSAAGGAPSAPVSRWGAWFDFWFYPVQNSMVLSGFPPLGWISFCVLGMLYARIMLHRRWTPRATVAANLAVATVLAALFVATRLLHVGNLSEGCLRMAEHLAHPGRNQYLASIKSFFYITKYPPSPSFFALTMAANFGLLALFSAIPAGVAKAIPGLMDYGGSALFFYVAHMFLYSLLSVPARYWFEHELADRPPNDWEQTRGLGDSAAFWITWLLGLAMLSPMCRAYGRFKAAQSTDSLWRFF